MPRLLFILAAVVCFACCANAFDVDAIRLEFEAAVAKVQNAQIAKTQAAATPMTCTAAMTLANTGSACVGAVKSDGMAFTKGAVCSADVDDVGCNNGVCSAGGGKAALGVECDAVKMCKDGLVCSSSKVCVPSAQNGASCKLTGTICSQPGATCVSNVCTGKKSGATCTGGDCDAGLFCSPNDMRCVASMNAGQSLTLSSEVLAKGTFGNDIGFMCNPYQFLLPIATSTTTSMTVGCAALFSVGAGGACVASVQCASGLSCANQKCIANTVGSVCSETSECSGANLYCGCSSATGSTTCLSSYVTAPTFDTTCASSILMTYYKSIGCAFFNVNNSNYDKTSPCYFDTASVSAGTLPTTSPLYTPFQKCTVKTTSSVDVNTVLSRTTTLSATERTAISDAYIKKVGSTVIGSAVTNAGVLNSVSPSKLFGVQTQAAGTLTVTTTVVPATGATAASMMTAVSAYTSSPAFKTDVAAVANAPVVASAAAYTPVSPSIYVSSASALSLASSAVAVVAAAVLALAL